jgi:HEPN domain-containing protein
MASYQHPQHHGLYAIQSVADYAAIFHEAADALSRDFARYQWAPLPMLMNEAFALELYLKTLHLIVFEKMPRTHDLYELYSSLPERDHAGLIHYYEQVVSSLPPVQENGIAPDDRLEALILALRTAFEDVRYFFEREQSYTFKSLHYVLRAAREYLASIKYDEIPRFRSSGLSRREPFQGVNQNRVAHPKAMLQVARMFAGGLNILDAALSKSQHGLLMISYSVNAGFTFELYLKCLCFVTRKQYPRTHSLKKIFKCVSEKHQAGVLARYRQENPDRRDTFERLLIDATDAFGGIRYGFERTNIGYSITTPEKAIKAIDAYLVETWPELLVSEI